MTRPVLSRIPFLAQFVDERFLEHRRRSTSLAAIVGALVALVFFEFRIFHDHTINWDLFTVICAMVVAKVSMMIWFRFKD